MSHERTLYAKTHNKCRVNEQVQSASTDAIWKKHVIHVEELINAKSVCSVENEPNS